MPIKKNQLEQEKRVKILVQLLKSDQLTKSEIEDLNWEYNFLLYQNTDCIFSDYCVYSLCEQKDARMEKTYWLDLELAQKNHHEKKY